MKEYTIRPGIYALAAAVALTFGACSKDDNSSQEPETPETPTTPETPSEPSISFDIPDYSLLSCNSLTANEVAERYHVMPFEIPGMSDAFDLNMLATAFLANDAKITAEMRALTGIAVSTVYKEAVLQYTSVDQSGEPISLSGRICWQEWTAPADAPAVPKSTPEVMVIESHFTITDNASCPSLSRSVMDCWSYRLPAIALACDYQGYGVSAASVHPYLNEELTARQQVDFVKAAYHWLATSCPNLNLTKFHTYSMGYSQGGAVAVAVQKWLEKNEPALTRALNFRGTMAGDGPYDLQKTLAYYMQSGEVEMPVVIPMIVKGMMASYPELFEGISITDYFKPSFLNVNGQPGALLAMIDSKQYNIVTFMGLFMKLTGKTSLPVTEILSPEAMNPDSRIFKALYEALGRNNVLAGWTPAHPIWFYHCEKDAVVPFCNLDMLQTGIWPTDKYRIESVAVPDNHLAGYIAFYLKAATFMQAK